MKYYKVPRFLKIQEVDDKDVKKKVESDWVEVDKNGQEINQKQKKEKVNDKNA